MILSTYDRLLLEGEAKGERKALRDTILSFASSRCGEADESVKERLAKIEDLSRLRGLVKASPDAQSWAELLGDE